MRELKNVIERAVLVAEGAAIDVAGPRAGAPAPRRAPACRRPAAAAATAPAATALPESSTRSSGGASSTRSRQCGGNQTRAAELLGMPRRTLVKRLAQYGIQRPRR